MNLDHATKHGVTVEEAERVVLYPGRGWPQRNRGDTPMVQGRGTGGRLIQVIYTLGGNDRDPEYDRFYVLHAMAMTTRRRRRGR